MTPLIKRSQIACMNMHYKNYSLDYFLASVQRIGYESVAFWGGPPHFLLEEAGYEDAKLLRKKFTEHGLTCTCFTAAALLPPYQFAVEGTEQIEDTYRYFANGIRVAAELGAGVMVANSGYGQKTGRREDAWGRSRDMLRRVAEFAGEYNVCLTIESLRPQETNLVVTLSDTKRMADEVNHPNLKVMIDTTAIGVSGETVWDWFKVFGSDIKNMHFVDGTPFGHLSWGDGSFPLEDMLSCMQRYGYDGPLGLEITDPRYYVNPAMASIKSFNSLVRYAES